MFKPKNHRERVTHRLKIAKGHLQKVIDMVDNGDYCIDVINQSLAVQKALSEVDSLILENHLKTCAADAIKKGASDNAIAEVMRIFKRR